MGGGSLKKRLFIVGGGVTLLIIIAIVFFSVISGGGKGATQQLVEIAQEQTEIIRVADIGVTKAKGPTAKNLAITIKYSITTAQNDLLVVLEKLGSKPGAKILVLKKNANTDKVLDAAAANNNFDETFTETMKSELVAYQVDLKKAYDAASSQTTKQVLADSYNGAGVLIGGEQSQAN